MPPAVLHRRNPRPHAAVTTPEPAEPVQPPAPPRSEAARLRAESASLPPLDAVALVGALPSTRRFLLWQAPEEDAWVGIGRCVGRPVLREGAPAGTLPELGRTLVDELASRLEGAGRPPRCFFTVTFDPERHSGGDGVPPPWRGFAPLEIFVPEILVRCGPSGSEASLVGGRERLAELRAELAGLVDATRDGGAPLEGPRQVRNLVIEWAATRHRRNVEAALAALGRRPPGDGSPGGRHGGLTKVVLAHGVEVRRDRPFDPAALLADLARAHPSCFLFAHRPAAGGPVFLGASPERLARVEAAGDPRSEARHDRGDRRVLSGALAGSAPRGTGAAEDGALGRRLLESAKDREEHAIVGEMIAGALGPLCRSVEGPGEPVLEKLANVQHLYTPISGRLLPGRGVLDAVAALHPTPAVGGMPRDLALAAIRQLEPEPRGLYAGVLGWVSPDGHGDSAVAIRSALVDGCRARVFAGGGIVPTSDPDVEVEEARLKMAAILGAMK
ncbi:MAG: isochorismate synthase MenF, partial [Thermoanaerobaculia bacterium]